jgi:hypothetical protein
VRVNLSVGAHPFPPARLLNTWIRLLSEEFQVKEAVAKRWIQNIECLDFVGEFLQSQGWKVKCYRTPPLDGKVMSFGLLISRDCECLTEWLLTETI